MEVQTRIKVIYSQEGHYMYPEDSWEDSAIISDKKSLTEMMKEWHKMSASSFNNYPFNGLFSTNSLTFEIQKFVIINGEEFIGPSSKTDRPDFFEDSVKEYKEWYDYIKKRLPVLQKLKENRLKEEREKNLFEQLKEKFL